MSLKLSRKRVRYSFSNYNSNKVSIPNLIKIQCRSYERFLQFSTSPHERKNEGLENVLRSTFDIDDPEGRLRLEYINYSLSPSKYQYNECIHRGINYASPLRVSLRLILWDHENSVSKKEIRGIKEQEVYFGEVPLMTETGTFIINGAQRVIVSQLHRSPGVFYSHDNGKASALGKFIYSARIIPYRGSWFDFEFDVKDIIYFRIDKKRKLPISTLLRALGLSTFEIISTFYEIQSLHVDNSQFITTFVINRFLGRKLKKSIFDYDTGRMLVESGIRISKQTIPSSVIDNKKIRYAIDLDNITGMFVAKPILYKGSVIAQAGQELTKDLLKKVLISNITCIDIIDVDDARVGPYIRDTMYYDKNKTEKEALAEIYKLLRPGEHFDSIVAKDLFFSTFSDSTKYDLSNVGRMKLNIRHGLTINANHTTLVVDDFIAVIKNLVSNKCGFGVVDDIDSLSNRRVRSVGELVENQFRIGLSKMKKSVLDKLSTLDPETVQPHDLVNTRNLVATLREFFCISQLSQFMDQTNPLSEITHKRRLSALGPGGLTRDRAGFEVRDVHTSHYSRICPIETPEGQNIGLISSLAIYAGVDKYGFIESPYRKVNKSVVTDEIVHLTAMSEDKYIIANAINNLDSEGKIIKQSVVCRKKGEIVKVNKNNIHYMDVSPQQLVSVAASLIPFLENNDANRALMGSNMQRQAVPLIVHEAPLVGTGIESVVAENSGAYLKALRSGVISMVDSKRIVIKVQNSGVTDISNLDIYNLVKYQKSNQGTCMNHKPIVDIGDFVEKDEIIADGVCTDKGELALGKNVLVAFMPWNGYNFEDSIVLSERLVREDVFTSIHIKEYEVVARDTRLGPEEITRELPSVSDDYLQNIDEVGIVNIGAKVKSGDILVGKVTPRTESPLTPEEKLLRAIFGEKAADVKNSSLKLPPGEQGTVVDVKIFTKRGVSKNERSLDIERKNISTLLEEKDNELQIIEEHLHELTVSLIINKKVMRGNGIYEDNSVVTNDSIHKLFNAKIFHVIFSDAQVNTQLCKILNFYDDYRYKLQSQFEDKVNKLQSGDDLPQGVLQVVKVYVASKLKIQAGDKMAGRHGNKGIVSKIVPIEDMPFLENGRSVDMVLNPLGVPSRMNIGQILETHLGWASEGIADSVRSILERYKLVRTLSNKEMLRSSLKQAFEFGDYKSTNISHFINTLSDKDLLELATDTSKGIKFATPVFDGATDHDINLALRKAGFKSSGQHHLRDGKTGKLFDKKVTVGYIYMMKLDHLVDSKMHARSIGPYSLVTQQPLGGRSHFGGQRIGEMEVWAFEAYGAAYTLREMLTVKSDDVSGRVKTYESIIGNYSSQSASFLPESFKVMIKEIKSLGLNIEMIEKQL